METLPNKSQGTTALSTLTPSTVLRELPKSDVINMIGDQLDRLAKLYQVPNWDAVNTVLLSEWIVDTYHSDLLKTVLDCLSRPRRTDKVWRLTPDTITEWMTSEQEALAARRENYVHNAKHEEVKSEWTDERLEELKKITQSVEAPKISSLTQEDIEKEGQEKPLKPTYIPPGKEYYVMNQLLIKYGRECTDPHTGRALPGALSFEEWILTQERGL